MSQAGLIDIESSNPQIPTSFVTDSGTAIPIGNVLEVLGGTDCTTSGSGNTIIIDVAGFASATYTADSGSATPSANNLNIFGSGSIVTSGSGDTISVSLTTLANHNVLLGSGSNTINSTPPSSTSGIPLISNGLSADPSFGIASVAGGGTGTNTLTDHGVLIGNGTSPVTAVAPGAADLPLISSGPLSDPYYSVLPIAGGGTNASSMASTYGINYFDGTSIVTTSAGQAGYVLTGNGPSAPATFEPLGTVTPVAFLAYVDPATSNDVTGDGTEFLVPFNVASFNLNSNYDPLTYTFTTPNDGVYEFDTAVLLNNVNSSHTLGTLAYLVNGTDRYYGDDVNPGAEIDSNNRVTLQGSVSLELSSGDTVQIVVAVAGDTKTVGIYGNGSANIYSYFSGAVLQSGLPFTIPINVPTGGTGNTTLDDHSVLIGAGTNPIAFAAPGTAGLVLTSNGPGADPSFQAAAASFVWNSVSGTSQTLVPSNGYVNQNSSLTTFALPASASFGEVFVIAGVGTGGWRISQASGQQIIVGEVSSIVGVGGSVSSTKNSDNIYLLCITDNTTFKALYWSGNLDIV